jgi:hypothetical protein
MLCRKPIYKKITSHTTLEKMKPTKKAFKNNKPKKLMFTDKAYFLLDETKTDFN